MSRLSRFLILAVLGIALIPTAAHAQFFMFPGGGYGGWPWGGYGYGGWPNYGFGGMPYYGNPYYTGLANGYGSWGMTPASYTFITPVMYTVSTPSSGYRPDVPVEPRMRPAVWPAIPYRDASRTDARARLEVRVPSESAQVSLNGVAMTQQTGLERHYITPTLATGTYSFDVRVSWRDAAGKEMTRTRQVEVRPGETQTVDFLVTP